MIINIHYAAQYSVKFPADQSSFVTEKSQHGTLLPLMQIKALPNGAAAWHGAVPESRAGQCSEGYRSSTQAAAWKLNWNSWVPNTPGADLCEESSARRRPRAAVTAQTLKLNLTLDDKQEISHKCDPISSERTIQVHQT